MSNEGLNPLSEIAHKSITLLAEVVKVEKRIGEPSGQATLVCSDSSIECVNSYDCTFELVAQVFNCALKLSKPITYVITSSLV